MFGILAWIGIAAVKLANDFRLSINDEKDRREALDQRQLSYVDHQGVIRFSGTGRPIRFGKDLETGDWVGYDLYTGKPVINVTDIHRANAIEEAKKDPSITAIKWDRSPRYIWKNKRYRKTRWLDLTRTDKQHFLIEAQVYCYCYYLDIETKQLVRRTDSAIEWEKSRIKIGAKPRQDLESWESVMNTYNKYLSLSIEKYGFDSWEVDSDCVLECDENQYELCKKIITKWENERRS